MVDMEHGRIGWTPTQALRFRQVAEEFKSVNFTDLKLDQSARPSYPTPDGRRAVGQNEQFVRFEV